jgi:hypothetical protein
VGAGHEEVLSQKALADLPNVEIVPRVQPHSGRIIIHLLNRSGDRVSGMKLRLRMPEARRDGVNLFYARDGQGPEWQWHEGTIEVPVRELDVYDVIVVQQLEE